MEGLRFWWQQVWAAVFTKRIPFDLGMWFPKAVNDVAATWNRYQIQSKCPPKNNLFNAFKLICRPSGRLEKYVCCECRLSCFVFEVGEPLSVSICPPFEIQVAISSCTWKCIHKEGEKSGGKVCFYWDRTELSPKKFIYY